MTKAAERDLADCVVVSNLHKPNNLTHHLLVLCVNKRIPVGSIEQLSSQLAPLLNIKSASAVAVLKDSSGKSKVAIDEIKSLLEVITLPWLQKPDAAHERTLKDFFQPTKICINKSSDKESSRIECSKKTNRK